MSTEKRWIEARDPWSPGALFDLVYHAAFSRQDVKAFT